MAAFRGIRLTAAVLIAAGLLAGCGSVEKVSTWWRGDASEVPRLPPGYFEYVCDGSKTFQVRPDPGGQFTMIRFPDREFRLDAVPGAVAGRFTNGRSTLNVKNDEAFLTDGTTVAFANCKRVNQG